MTHNDKDAANALAIHYQKIGSLDFSETDRHTQRKARAVAHGCRTTDSKEVIFTKEFSLQVLEQALFQMDWTKSPGPDGLHGRMIEHLGPVGRQSLLDIFNLSWRDGRLPRYWKRAIIIPIKKPGKEAGSPESYRPIALTSIICKIMERMILARG
ncbi:hypothetical protein AVEN_256844-1 [Araneus ventricosus]|uniref:RNA-directed DNA polymerase from mobile element jockey n=1 Tax=Araneus ventricosus TaxID=182803 RepID=A0A4Y2UDX0_ARAVE|nr:hypothetical protein AVEN_256844-1 [Araneus ventricosus]